MSAWPLVGMSRASRLGSLSAWLPEHGVGLIAMGNVTYAGLWVVHDALSALLHCAHIPESSAVTLLQPCRKTCRSMLPGRCTRVTIVRQFFSWTVSERRAVNLET